jgi:hypothetical protein
VKIKHLVIRNIYFVSKIGKVFRNFYIIAFKVLKKVIGKLFLVFIKF